MRPILIGALAGSAALVSARSTCVQDNLDEIVSRTSCGDDGAISRCLSHADLEKLDEIELCFYTGGCEIKDAVVGAQWFSEDCHASEEVGRGELRKRASSATTDKTTTASTTAAASTTIASTSATTTADSSSSTDTSTTTSASTASSTLSTSTTSSSSSSSASSTSSSSSSSSLVCSTTSSFSTSVCSYSSGTSYSCTPTMTGTLTCAAGNLCSTDSAGNGVCMKRQDSLTTSGVVVTIAFSVGIVSFLVALLVMCFQAKSRMKKDQAERMALLTSQTYGKEPELASTPPAAQSYAQRRAAQRGGDNAEADVPLIPTDGSHGENQSYYGHGQTATSSRDQSPSNSAPVHPGHPALS
ncbi:hypothetical protein BP5796_00129 [Coleophoma crateriformis]|uniref:Extracellular membrane protein CFEM domain-containing protein n=1 Tax=Coleophoma crateriformis TaxID=565419 RepID=A0A3D8T741_9HELO|nr:hypothetical protein BP5796_00129 [Coleophoma crateriformis]